MAGKIPPAVMAFFGWSNIKSQDSAGAPLVTKSYRMTPKNNKTVPVQNNRTIHSKNLFSFLIYSA